MQLPNAVALVSAIALPLGLGFVGSLISDAGESDWYKRLRKPSWTPPNWAFPVVWTNLYILMGVASWMIWLHGGFERQSIPLGVYLFQLLLNFLWTPIFFGLHRPGLALVEIALLWLAIAETMYLFWKVTPLATYLMIPYIIWVTLASTLNLYIWVHYTSTTHTSYEILQEKSKPGKAS